MSARLAAVALTLLALGSCQLPGSSAGCTTTQIDWVDFIEVGSTQYVAGLAGQPTTLAESDLGPIVARVKFKVDGNVCDPSYRPKDGDAAFLDPGTPIYQVNGHAPSELLAARRGGEILAYKSMPPSGS